MFKDFAVYDNAGTPDPVVSYVRNGAEVTSGGVGNAWTRPYMTFVPDRDSAFLAIGARVQTPNQAVAGSEHLNAQYFTQWQLERAQASYLPRAYSPAREVQVVVKPDRLSLVVNPRGQVGNRPSANSGTWVTTENVTVTGHPSAITVGTSVSPTVNTQNQIASVFNVDGLGASTISRRGGVWIKSSRGCNADAYLEGDYSGTTQITAVAADVWTWVVTKGHGVGSFIVIVRTTSGNALTTDSVQFAGAVAETTFPSNFTYFDGSMGDDYLWESGFTSTTGRSFYYENRLDRGEATTRVIRDAVPLGIGVGAAQFGVFTD